MNTGRFRDEVDPILRQYDVISFNLSYDPNASKVQLEMFPFGFDKMMESLKAFERFDRLLKKYPDLFDMVQQYITLELTEGTCDESFLSSKTN